jgi:hypothetical protein
MYLRARIMELGADLQVLNDAPKKYVIVSTSLLLEQSCNVAISAEALLPSHLTSNPVATLHAILLSVVEETSCCNFNCTPSIVAVDL